MTFRIASATTGGTLHLMAGGTNLSGTVTVPGTGGWQTWTSVTASGIPLSSGTQAIRLAFDSGSFNVNSMTFALVTASTPPPVGSSVAASSAKKSGGGGGGGGCGLTGLEGLALTVLLAMMRKWRRD